MRSKVLKLACGLIVFYVAGIVFLSSSAYAAGNLGPGECNTTGGQPTQCSPQCDGMQPFKVLQGGTINPPSPPPYVGAKSDYGNAACPIDIYGECRYINNASPHQDSIFVPFKTWAEWSAFETNKPSYIAVKHCTRGQVFQIYPDPDGNCHPVPPAASVPPQPVTLPYAPWDQNYPPPPGKGSPPITEQVSFSCQDGNGNPWTETASQTFTASDPAWIGGVVTYTSPPNPGDCSSQQEQWMVGSTTCSGTIAAATNNTTTPVASTNGNTGTATYYCGNGVYSQIAGATCSPPAQCGGPDKAPCCYALWCYIGCDGQGASPEMQDVNWSCIAGGPGIGASCSGTWMCVNSVGSTPCSASCSSVFVSDRRLKTDIVKVGSRNGYNIYEFSYRADPDHHRYRGVMAQEAMDVPDAVITMPNGYYAVNYSVLGVPFEQIR